MQLIILICVIIGAIIAIAVYRKVVITLNKESKKFSLEKFQYGKRLNAELLNKVRSYAIENNLMNDFFIQGLTFNQCIKMLEEVRQKIFNSENEEAVRLILTTTTTPYLNNRLIEELIKTVDIQTKHHNELDTVFKIYITTKQ